MKEFTKSDLKEGMVVVNRKGANYIFFENLKVFSRYGEFSRLKNYTENLKNRITDSWDIMKVYTPLTAEIIPCFLYPEKFTPVWERKEEIELTLQEIADKFDIDVKKLRIKE